MVKLAEPSRTNFRINTDDQDPETGGISTGHLPVSTMSVAWLPGRHLGCWVVQPLTGDHMMLSAAWLSSCSQLDTELLWVSRVLPGLAKGFCRLMLTRDVGFST